jgi:cytochrome d ubiquinol oxidase subunit II
MDLAVFWYAALGILLGVYAVLDGFDLGVGIVHLAARGDLERRYSINSIGPLWDGNEVWLVTFGGALFAAFPEAYASILSAFYLPIMLLLFFLVGRAVSIEFRSKRKEPWWRTYWDVSFSLSSGLTVFCFGLLAGNLILGVRIDEAGVIDATLGEVVRPYPLAVALLTVLGAATHGAIFLHAKTDGVLQARALRVAYGSYAAFLLAYLGVTAATFALAPHALRNFERWPAAWIVVALNLLALVNVPRALRMGQPGQAFASSCASLASLCFLFGMAMFPFFAFDIRDPSHGIELSNACSSERTLGIMQIVALIGLPLVVSYTVVVYWVFRGKVKLGDNSY